MTIKQSIGLADETHPLGPEFAVLTHACARACAHTPTHTHSHTVILTNNPHMTKIMNIPIMINNKENHALRIVYGNYGIQCPLAK